MSWNRDGYRIYGYLIYWLLGYDGTGLPNLVSNAAETCWKKALFNVLLGLIEGIDGPCGSCKVLQGLGDFLRNRNFKVLIRPYKSL